MFPFSGGATHGNRACSARLCVATIARMSWSSLGTQFCLELAFGVLTTLVFVARAPLGTFFFRLMGATALVPLVVAIGLPLAVHSSGWSDPRWFGSGLAAALFLVYSGPVRARTREVALVIAALGCAVSLALEVRSATGVTALAPWLTASFSALSTGLVGGSVGLAMVFGHWYLTVPTLEVAWLVRLNRLTMIWMVTSLLALSATIFVFADSMRARDIDPFGPWPMFHVGTRVLLGIAMPLVFGWMTSQSLTFKNTRSATGILYASTVLVLIASAIAVFLQDIYGVPL
jgi:hypothetical protein